MQSIFLAVVARPVATLPRAILAATTLAVAMPSIADASIVIGGTRVIYPAREREVTVRLVNDGQQPALVQTWLDKGDANAAPEEIEVPFTLAPPMFRVDPAQSQSLRLIYTREPLPQDRESVFWLNILEVPPKPTAEAGANIMQLAFRSRIKLFFRPHDLAGDPATTPRNLRWKISTSPGSAPVLRVTNPGAFHVSITQAAVMIGGKTYAATSSMIAPTTTLDLPLAVAGKDAEPIDKSSNGDVHFTWINDYGASITADARLDSDP